MGNHKNRAKGRQRQTIFFSEFCGSRITGIDESLLDEQQKEKLEAVIKKIKDEAGIQATGGIAFSYDQKSSGKVTIVTSKDNAPKIEGSFSRSTSESGTTFQITINGKEYDCKFKLPERSILQRVSPHETLARFLIG